VTFALSDEALQQAQNDATALVIGEQERTGLDLITDGEQRRVQFINHVLACWDGIDLEKQSPKSIRRRIGVERPVPTVVGQVKRRQAAVVEDLKFAKAQASRPVKMAVPGPMTVVDTTYDAAYGNEEALAMDVAAALNSELLDLQAAGCDMVQIDEPAMTRYHEKVAAYGLRALDRCLEGVHIPSIVHLCYGYPGTGPKQHEYLYDDLLPLLMQTRIGGFSVEFARSGYDPAVLAQCQDRLVILGCVDPGDTPVEPLENVAAQVREATHHVPSGNLLLAPDCGLMTISRDLARAKCALLVEVAQQVRQEL
jgi:5-methyltetrahydropteroyltriglutamate--homocysteine methyltransferase